MRLHPIKLPKLEQEHDEWTLLTNGALSRAYGEDEPEYTPKDIKIVNPVYEGR